MRILTALIITAAVLTGCLDATEPQVIYDWRGFTQEGEGEPGWEHLYFESAFLWYENQQIVVAAARVTDDEPASIRSWHVHSGSCASGGDILGQDGSYPVLEVDGTGEAYAETGFNFVLDPTLNYHVRLYLAPNTDTLIACIDMELANL